jgi:hypothetical protein
MEAFETSTAVYPVKDHTETTDASGQFSTALGVPDTGTAHYRVRLPDNTDHEFYLEAGTAVDLVTLLTVAGTSAAPSALQTLLDAAEVFTIRSASITGDIVATDELVLASGTITLTLPAATGSGVGYAVKNTGTGTITVEGSSSETIDGSANVTLDANDSYVFIDSASGAWVSI